jgi:methionyl aminopeptidase
VASDKMIYLKSDEEIELIKLSADVLGRTHAEVAKIVKPGVKTKELDKVAFEFISDHKGFPSFLNYQGFPASLCISVNEVVVHGIPSNRVLLDGDIVSIDCGVILNKYHSDSAYTYEVGNVREDIKKLLKVTKESLYEGIKFATTGNRVGDLAFSIQNHCEKNGYGVVRELVGHGVGRYLHESPEVPNYGKRGNGPKLVEGMVLAIEPMITLGSRAITQENDGWTIRTNDRKPSAHFEHTVAIRKGTAEILTTFKYIEEVLNKQV